MADRIVYDAIGEESTRGTAESSTVGFIPIEGTAFPTMEFNETPRGEARGENPALGDVAMIRWDGKWSHSMDMLMFTEAGTVAGIVGTIFKHFFGKASSAQNGATGQYGHMLYPVSDPFATANLATKALTLNHNVSEGAVTKNHAFEGGRISALNFVQEPGTSLKVGLEMFGQKKVASGTAIASPVFAAENLRCDFVNFTLYNGTITRTGTGPDFTDFSFGSATAIKPDSCNISLTNEMEDVLRLGGVAYPDKTRLGKYKVTLEFTIDLEDPASGFSSFDDFNLWLNSASATNFFANWDTGTQAGTGDNHSLGIDMPIMQRMGGEPDFNLETDPMITLKYEGLYDAATAKYVVGMLLKNTATAI